MPFKVIVTRDFDHMSEVTARIAADKIKRTFTEKDTAVLGLATGNTSTGLYKHLADAANAGEFDCPRIVSFNLEEYIGLPGENAQSGYLSWIRREISDAYEHKISSMGGIELEDMSR
jgi:glucosamine-6-phosphate deaminase